MTLLSILVLGNAPAYGQSENEKPKANFICENKGSSYSTFMKDIDGNIRSIFHWINLPSNYKPSSQEVCITYTQKLNKYYSKKATIDSLKLNYYTRLNFPVICFAEKNNDCQMIFFVLPPDLNGYQSAKEILSRTLDEKLEVNWIENRDRELLSVEVDISWKAQ